MVCPFVLGKGKDEANDETGNMFLSPVSAVVQLRPQLHHLDALDEIPKKGGRSRKEEGEERGEPEARAVDVKIKAAATEDAEVALVQGNLELLKKMQEEKWSRFEWVDAEVFLSFSFCWFMFGYFLGGDANWIECRHKKLGTSMKGT